MMRIYLAPIRGITDYIYRNTFSRYFPGVDVAVAPFISSVQGRKIKAAYLRDILPENNMHMALIPQILSNDPADFLFMAEQIFAMGWREINWNLGCPAPMVANKHRGSGLLAEPLKICRVLDEVLRRFPGHISIKVRLGRRSPTELGKLLPLLENYPLSEIIIHPRLGTQMYKGVPDLDGFERCLSLTGHKVVYNGDIVDYNSFKMVQGRFGALVQPESSVSVRPRSYAIKNWMIGRGLLSDPFLAGRIRNQGMCLKIGNIKDILSCFHDDLLEQYSTRLCGDSHVIGRMKGIWFYLADIFENSVKIRKKINKTCGLNDYLAVVKNIFSGYPIEKT